MESNPFAPPRSESPTTPVVAKRADWKWLSGQFRLGTHDVAVRVGALRRPNQRVFYVPGQAAARAGIRDDLPLLDCTRSFLSSYRRPPAR